MGSLLFPKYLLLLVALFSLYSSSIIAQYEQERDSLYALKHTFNDPFLNDNWNGLQCYENTSFWYGIQCVNGRVTAILLEGMGLSGEVSAAAADAIFIVLSELIILSFKNNSLSGNVMDFSSNQKLKDIDLSKNMFDGPIPRSLVNLNFLESLQLQENHLTGTIPEFNQASLKAFNVSNNNIRGPIPGTRTLKSFSAASYSNNGPNMCDSSNSDTCHFSEIDTEGDSRKKSTATIFMVFDIIGLVTVVLLLILYRKKSRKLKKLVKRYHLEEKDDEGLELEEGGSYYKVSKDETNIHAEEKRLSEEKGNIIFMADEAGFDLYDLLRASTEGLGKGLLGNCYKAALEGRPALVVKHLRELKPLSNEEFTKLLRIIGNQKHPNLLPLLAYYYSKNEKLLVYRYVKNGNLFSRLHGGRGSRDRISFTWSSRLSVARGVARALEYLHLNSNPSSLCPVPHGNLKLANVLLDENDTVLVSDYGLTSIIALPMAAKRMASYKSPEYENSKTVSRKSDVWSFGCLLLELLTGRPSVHSAPPGINGVDLCSWVRRAIREEWTAEIIDREISVQKSAAPEMQKLLQVAIRCCDNTPENRPEMAEIAREIYDIKAIETDDEDQLSADQSLTAESFSTHASSSVIIVGDGRSW